MEKINIGDTLYIPVVVGGGAFLGESLITFDTLEGPVSGFINSRQVENFGDTNAIAAKVEDVDSSRILVRIHGSFFTTTGLAEISPQTPLARAV